MEKQKDVVFVRHDALNEEVQVVEQKQPGVQKSKKESSLNRKTIPCDQQAEQWF